MGYGLPSTLGAHLHHRQWNFHFEVPAPAELEQLSFCFSISGFKSLHEPYVRLTPGASVSSTMNWVQNIHLAKFLRGLNSLKGV